MDTNQWNVMSLEAFRYYNCPDCEEMFTLKNTFVEPDFQKSDLAPVHS